MVFAGVVAWRWASIAGMSREEVPVPVPRSLVSVWAAMELLHCEPCSIDQAGITSWVDHKPLWSFVHKVLDVVAFKIRQLGDVDLPF